MVGVAACVQSVLVALMGRRLGRVLIVVERESVAGLGEALVVGDFLRGEEGKRGAHGEGWRGSGLLTAAGFVEPL